MTKGEAIATAIATLEAIKQFGMGKWMFDKEEIEAFDMAIEALSAKTDGDLISRQDAIDAMWKALYAYEDLAEKQFMEHEELELGDWLQHRIFVQRMHEECMKAVNSLPSAEPKTDEENELKFYYVESIDDYWIGARLDNFYYADWHEGLGFVWSHSRYLPWGEHIVDENTLWKEHTYPSEPIEIPFTEWIVGFVKKYFTEPRTGEWVSNHDGSWNCSECGLRVLIYAKGNFCPNCGAKMYALNEQDEVIGGGNNCP